MACGTNHREHDAMQSGNICFTADLVKYMEKSVSVSSGDRSSASATLGGLVGSSVAPAALGVQYLPQPAAAQPHIRPMGQGDCPCLSAALVPQKEGSLVFV